ncbi:hypothetical protein BaRGS_00032815 [Batillaria attramentaria]|uniref:Uncharacterized protein n=1 Tax=Batillaria attramentaria TaxID=370345 RepID=A0ABD0JM12_9CAEN
MPQTTAQPDQQTWLQGRAEPSHPAKLRFHRNGDKSAELTLSTSRGRGRQYQISDLFTANIEFISTGAPGQFLSCFQKPPDWEKWDTPILARWENDDVARNDGQGGKLVGLVEMGVLWEWCL